VVQDVTGPHEIDRRVLERERLGCRLDDVDPVLEPGSGNPFTRAIDV
jgi:hypothetical protein